MGEAVKPLFEDLTNDGACAAFHACRDRETKSDARAFLEQAWLHYRFERGGE